MVIQFVVYMQAHWLAAVHIVFNRFSTVYILINDTLDADDLLNWCWLKWKSFRFEGFSNDKMQNDSSHRTNSIRQICVYKPTQTECNQIIKKEHANHSNIRDSRKLKYIFNILNSVFISISWKSISFSIVCICNCKYSQIFYNSILVDFIYHHIR